MRISTLAIVFAVVLLAATAEATTQPYYFHYSSSGVTMPSGGDVHYYLNGTAPTASTPVVTNQITISRDDTEPLPVFTSTTLSATTLEKLATVTLNLSANGTMSGCAVLSGTLEHVTSGGTATTIGQAIEKTVTIPAGTGGGLVGYQAFPLAFALDVEGRQIPSGDSLRVRTYVTNSCASNRSVRLVFDGTVTTGSHSRAEFATPDIALYGEPGSFGTYDGTIVGGATLATGYAQDFSIDVGLTFFLTDVTSDGTVFNGNFYTSSNTFNVSSCSTVVTCFNPDAATCNDGNDNPVHFSNIRMPDEDGNEFSPTTASPNACPTPRGGVDIADVAVVEDGGEHVQFLSSHSFAFNTNDVVLGRLEKTSGMWGIESLQYPSDVGADCPDGDCDFVAEMERLPGSGHIVYAQYFRNPFNSNPEGVVFVTDASGNLKAWSYEPSLMADVNGCSGGLLVTAKSVEVDPSSASSCGGSGCSDERFAILHDPFTTTAPASGRSFTFQEYRYDTTQDPPVLEPVTPALMIKSPVGHSPQVNSVPCGTSSSGTSQGIGGWYDHEGNFWTGRAGSLIDVFVKDPTTGKRRFETDSACKWAGHEHEWGVTCPADLEFSGGGAAMGFADDPVTGNVLGIARVTGELTRFAPGTTGLGARTFSKKTTALDLNIDQLLPPYAYERRLGRPRVDVDRRIAWLPILTPQPFFMAGQDHWFVAVDLPRIMSYP